MTPLAPDAEVSITLQAQQWNVVLGALQDVPFRLAAPLIAEIKRQAELAQQMMGQPEQEEARHDAPA